MGNGHLNLTVKKYKEWVILTMPTGEKVRILLKNHVSKNLNYGELVIHSPFSIKINREKNDSIGNHE